jgi:hypothetical protein
MAAEKTSKKKGKGGDGGTALRLTSDPRKERRYEPKAGTTAILSVIGLSIGAVLLGAGSFGQWLRAEPLGPHPYAPWLLLGGALLMLAIAFLGPRSATPIRVGDAGVGKEKDGGDVDRIEWRDVSRVSLVAGDALIVESPGNTMVVPVKLHPQAAARILSEARSRIPGKVDEIEGNPLEPLDSAAGEVMPLEEAQVAGARCKATDKLIAFEKDARLCGKCGEVYHKDAVPASCMTCDAKLK